jgi:hypothetical protein
MEGDGVPQDEETARGYFACLDVNTRVQRLRKLALMLRCGSDVRIDLGESLRCYRRCCELGDVYSLDHLGRCYEKGIGVEVDLVEAVGFYERASALGSQASQLSLGVFHWRGIGGFSVDRQEAVRLWRLGGLDIPDSAVTFAESCDDSSARSSRFFSSTPETEETENGVRDHERLSLDLGTQFTFSVVGIESKDFKSGPLRSHSRSGPKSAPGRRSSSGAHLPRSAAVPRFDPSRESRGPSAVDRHSDPLNSGTLPIGDVARQDSVHLIPPGLPVSRRTCESFVFCISDHVIESVVLADNRSVRDFLGEGHPVGEIARLAGEGIRREGLRCLEGEFEKDEGSSLCEEILDCDSIASLLRLCAVFYTRNTFLYRRVNQCLRSGREGDAETGQNLGLYIGLLRECFCVSGESSPVLWERPNVVYRGADFTLDVVVDYARRREEDIRWQGFTSSSRDLQVALGFPGNVLFEITLVHPAPSLDTISAFKNEHEIILSPYQRFSLFGVRWDSDCGRWILSVGEQGDLPAVRSWITKVEAS